MCGGVCGTWVLLGPSLSHRVFESRSGRCTTSTQHLQDGKKSLGPFNLSNTNQRIGGQMLAPSNILCLCTIGWTLLVLNSSRPLHHIRRRDCILSYLSQRTTQRRPGPTAERVESRLESDSL